ncbi:hypothetical protein QBC35DRAFT_534289 [Podospora australis]|uniref:Uncharacterized protein n=1 Tax=Podospora australis TaxID=1536484 RepID=A0AAN6WPX5_9PEZI|nr:hypothetical protein QBC35DRAFT_534289 [Podospora australis]
MDVQCPYPGGLLRNMARRTRFHQLRRPAPSIFSWGMGSNTTEIRLRSYSSSVFLNSVPKSGSDDDEWDGGAPERKARNKRQPQPTMKSRSRVDVEKWSGFTVEEVFDFNDAEAKLAGIVVRKPDAIEELEPAETMGAGQSLDENQTEVFCDLDCIHCNRRPSYVKDLLVESRQKLQAVWKTLNNMVREGIRPGDLEEAIRMFEESHERNVIKLIHRSSKASFTVMNRLIKRVSELEIKMSFDIEEINTCSTEDDSLVRQLQRHPYTAIVIEEPDGTLYTMNYEGLFINSLPEDEAGVIFADQEAECSHIPRSDHELSDSDFSDLESIMSETPSLASSQSSMPLNVSLGAIQEVKTLLLDSERLQPMYDVALSKVGPDRFQNNFRRLLIRYGRALNQEATNPLQVQAALFICSAALRISVGIKNTLIRNELSESTLETGRDDIQLEMGETRLQMLNYFTQTGYTTKQTSATDSVKEQSVTSEEEKRFWDGQLEILYDPEEPSSDDESVQDPEDSPALHMIDNLKEFMLSSAAFTNLCTALGEWLQVNETQVQNESTEVVAHDEGAVEEEYSPGDPQSGAAFATSQKDGCNSPGSSRNPSAFGVFRSVWKRFWNAASDSLQPSVPQGHVRVSWTCRCGDRLRLQVPEHQRQAAISFAQAASGQNATTASTRTSSLSTLTSTSSGTESSDSSSTSGTTGSSSRPGSPNTIPSDLDEETGTPPEPFIPAGTKKYMLLCVNTGSTRGIAQRKLANVDVTHVNCSGQMFQRLQNAYRSLRNPWNPLLVPKTMQYVKFELLFLQKSGECVGSYETNSIPSQKEVLRQQYAFSPCPPKFNLPLPPDIFMHGFLDPGDHLGPMAVDMLPKKLWSKLRWNQNERFDIPVGWGFYIEEGINWALVFLCGAIALMGIFLPRFMRGSLGSLPPTGCPASGLPASTRYNGTPARSKLSANNGYHEPTLQQSDNPPWFTPESTAAFTIAFTVVSAILAAMAVYLSYRQLRAIHVRDKKQRSPDIPLLPIWSLHLNQHIHQPPSHYNGDGTQVSRWLIYDGSMTPALAGHLTFETRVSSFPLGDIST